MSTPSSFCLADNNSSVYQDNPGPVTVILLLLLVVAIVSTLSVVYRAVKHSPEVGVVGMVMACVVGAFCFVGMASVGMFWNEMPQVAADFGRAST